MFSSRILLSKTVLVMFSLLVSQVVFAFPIIGTGAGTHPWGSTTADWSCRYKAVQAAKSNMRVVASARCPNGYTINSSSCTTVRNATSTLVLGWHWPYYQCSANCSADITCNNSGQRPLFSYKPVNAQNYAVKMQREMKYRYPQLASFKDGYALMSEVKKQTMNEDTDLTPLFKAYEMGQMKTIRVPELKQFLNIQTMDDCSEVPVDYPDEYPIDYPIEQPIDYPIEYPIDYPEDGYDDY